MDGGEREESRFCINTESKDRKIIEMYMRVGKYHRMLLERHLNKNGLFRGQHQLLMCISQNPDASQKELARVHNVSTAAIAVSLKKLEKGGYIERLVDVEDNRYNKIRLTEKGRQEVENSIQFFDSAEQGMLKGFSDEEKDELYGYLRRFGENLEQMLR